MKISITDIAIWSVIAGLTLFATVSCIFPAPATDPSTGKIKSQLDGSTEWEYMTTPGKAKDQIDRALESKGFQRYKADVAQIAALQWIGISKYAGIGCFFCVIVWYFSKIREFGGAAIICILFSLIAVSMAEIVSNIGKVLLSVSAAIVIGLGWYLRHKSIMNLIRKWLS